MVTDMEHRDQKQSNHRLLQRAEEFVRRENMLPPGGGLVLCTVSGGLDSVTLLHFLHRLAEEENFRLTAAHFNHRLRGEASEEDARFVEQLCAQWSIPCVAGDGDVAAYAQEHGMGIEEAARHCRYAFLEEAAAALGAERIATAHQAEDNAETVLLQLIRGSGSEGLGGIAPVRDKLIRPFLTVSREEIEAYAAVHDIPHREDASNRDLHFARNRVRHQIMPLLQEINPAVVQAIGRAAAVRRQESELLQQIAQAEMGEVVVDNEGAFAIREYFQRTDPALVPRMLGILLDAAGLGRKDITAQHYEAMTELVLYGADGAELHLPGGRFWCAGNTAILHREDKTPQQMQPLMPGDSLCWGDYFIHLAKSEENFTEKWDTIRLKYDMIHLPLLVGPWERDQGMTLPPSRGQRSLKRLFADKGLSAHERDHAPVFYTDGQACAAAEIGADEAFLAEEGEAALCLMIKKIERD